MTIQTRDQLINAMANNSSRVLIDKASLNTTANSYGSLWRGTGQPGQGAIPGAAAVCDNTLVGALGFTQQTAPATSYITILEGANSVNSVTVEVHDRLMHMGGLSGTVTTAQTVNVDISANLATANLDARKGDANYSDVMWWLEWYTATGGTAVTATVNVTYNDGTSGNLTAISLAATRPASHAIPLNGYIPSADSGKFIRDVNTVTLSATTGTAGSFGVTATRYRGSLMIPAASIRYREDWSGIGLPEIPNSSCLMLMALCPSTSTGNIRMTGKISHG